MLKNQELNDKSLYVHLMNALCWDYSVEDHQLLERLEVFAALNHGNKDIDHPLRVAWGLQKGFYSIELEKKTNFNLPARLKQVYSFLANNIMDSVFVKR